MIKNLKWLLLVSLTVVACSSEDSVQVEANSSDGLPLTSGTANFTTGLVNAVNDIPSITHLAVYPTPLSTNDKKGHKMLPTF